MSPAPHVSPKVRAYGKARIDITRRAKDEDEWRKMWKEPSQPYLFTPGDGWRLNVLYSVNDYAAEIGFFIDVLGFPVAAFSPSQAQLTSPDGGFFLTILDAREGVSSMPPEALRLQLHVRDIIETVRELERRGVALDRQPAPLSQDSDWQIAAFRTPHGVVIEILGETPVAEPASGSGYGIAGHLSGESDSDDPAGMNDSAAQEEEVAPADESNSDQDFQTEPQVPGVAKTQGSVWSQAASGLGRLKVSKTSPQPMSKPGNGNIELTYDPLEDNADGEAIDASEDYP